MAKCRRRNIELLGRAREMQLFRDCHEIPEMTQFHGLKCHLLERCWRKLRKSSPSLTLANPSLATGSIIALEPAMTFRQRVALDRDVADLAQVTPVRVVIGRDEPVGVADCSACAVIGHTAAPQSTVVSRLPLDFTQREQNSRWGPYNGN